MAYCARNILEGLRTITEMSELKQPDVRADSLIVPRKDAGRLGTTIAFGQMMLSWSICHYVSRLVGLSNP